MSKTDRLLILSDGKPGHVNQSIAFAKHLGYEYDICRVGFRSRFLKAISYVADRFRVTLEALFTADKIDGCYRAVVSAGSETYYANRVLARKLGVKSVAIMLPQGYRLGFDLIVAQSHDNPPQRKNIINLPVNLSFVEPQGLVLPLSGCRYVSIIIGGDSKQVRLEPKLLESQLQTIFDLFPGHRFWLTTSRRTPVEIEVMLKKFSFDRAVYYSAEQINPIPDFLQHSEYLFLTADSSSMISEAVSFGSSAVEILPLSEALATGNKLGKMLTTLSRKGCLHMFDGKLADATQKINLTHYLGEVRL